MDESLDQLYAAPLDEFVDRRNRLVRELRSDGHGDRAAEVAKLRKPSVSAWAVNQLARTARPEIEALVTAGESLEAIQRSGMGGASAAGYEAARRRESEALIALRNRLPSVDPTMSGTTIERVVTTLRAGAATPDGRRQLLEGRLATDIEPGGFEPFAAAVAATAIEPAPQSDATVAAAERRRRQRLERDTTKAKAEAEEAETEAARLALDASEAEQRARDLRNLADTAADRARRTRRRAEELAAQLEEATG